MLLYKCLHEGLIPNKWHNFEVVILFKKGDITNIENYRPISLLSVLNKLLTKVLTSRLNNKFDCYRPSIGFHKTFDSIEAGYILDSINNARIDSRFTQIIKHMYENAEMKVKFNENLKTNNINIKRDVQ